MIVTALAARWLFTAVFAAAGLGAALPRRGPAGTARPMDRISAIFCAAMGAALTAMTWRPEPAAATWPQAALFGCAALGFGLTSLADHGRAWRPNAPALLHALMAGTMIWMLTAMPAMTGMTSPGPARGAMPPMPRAATPVPVLVISILLAVSCAAASLPWLARALGPGRRVKDPVSASQAAMNAGMAAMLLATLG